MIGKSDFNDIPKIFLVIQPIQHCLLCKVGVWKLEALMFCQIKPEKWDLHGFGAREKITGGLYKIIRNVVFADGHSTVYLGMLTILGINLEFFPNY